MRGLAQEEHRLWICATAKSCSRTRQEKMNFTLPPMAPDAIFMPLEKRSRRSCLGCWRHLPETRSSITGTCQTGGEEHTVYTFDYVAKPDIDTSGGVEIRIRFYISETQLKVAWTSYESVGSGDWEYLEKEVYEIPIGESMPWSSDNVQVTVWQVFDVSNMSVIQINFTK